MATEIGIDLGSYKTVIFSGSKIILEQPSIVTVDAETFKPIYFGEKAKQTLGRTPDTLECVRPIQNGLISDYEVAEAMLKHYMTEVFGNKIIRPKVMASIPAGLTELQHRSVSNVALAAGGRSINVVESPLAIAVGLDIDFNTPRGHLIVDIGAGTTDIAVISLGGIVSCQSFKTASFNFDEQIITHVRRSRNIEIGQLSAEQIKIQIGSVYARPVELTAISKGRNMFTGLPETFEVGSAEIYKILRPTAVSICNAIKKSLENIEPDIAADIKAEGLYLVGGGSLIFGMKELIEKKLGIPVNTVDTPQYSVVKGAAAALNRPEMMKNINYQLRSMKELEIH